MSALTLSMDGRGTRAAITFSHVTGNIVTAEIVTHLRTALEDLADAHHVKLLTIEGGGADFSFGASIPEHAPDRIAKVLPDMHALIRDLLDAPMPTAAVVRGRCLGGGFELALACDFIVAADTAEFGLPEIRLGVFPPAASVLLPLRAGAARAASAVLLGESRTAEFWRALGLVEWTAPAETLAAEVDAWYARTLEPLSAEALRHAVAALRRPLREAAARELPQVERLYLDELMRSHDAAEGIRAFLEKRKPRWTDR